jgi:hypothetical protein
VIEENAGWIVERWEHLTDSRYIGTPRPWRQPQRRRSSSQDQPAMFSTTPIPAPLHLDTHDLINEVLRKIRHLAVSTAVECGHDTVLSYLEHHRTEEPSEELDYIVRHFLVTSEEAQKYTDHTIGRIRARMAEEFAEILDGQSLVGDCPWCHQQELVIRLIGPPGAQQPVVLCENGGCNPPASECGKWYKGQPAWPLHEWEWLAARMG